MDMLSLLAHTSLHHEDHQHDHEPVVKIAHTCASTSAQQLPHTRCVPVHLIIIRPGAECALELMQWKLITIITPVFQSNLIIIIMSSPHPANPEVAWLHPVMMILFVTQQS